ncbi:MAG: hypothetical protein J3Q66DRAFT_397486 [Benniella sp.]|nr:MAG: hypothetical protein J3Q66DRAFT_397486 [Benniella sp.]
MFDYPELVAQLALYLSPQDLARCSATCKSFARTFEPYLYRQVTMEDKHSAPPSLPQHLQHVRMLRIYSRNVEGCLQAIAGVLDSTETMTNLQKLSITNIYYVGWVYTPVALNTVITLVAGNNRITHLELQMHTNLMGISLDPRLLDIIHMGLPRLQQFVVSGANFFSIVEAMKALKICLGHPSLTHAQLQTAAERIFHSRSDSSEHKALFESLLEFLDGTHKDGAQLQEVNGCQLTSLALPHIRGGYPRSFLLPLLRTYLPKLERLQVPFLDGSYEGELEEVIAGHCSNLCHIAYTFPMLLEDQNSSVIKAVIRGCARWNGLKSIRIFGYREQDDTDSSRGLVETLVKHHSKTLESVEIQAWDRHGGTSLLNPIFTGCPNLKSLKVLRLEGSTLHFLMYFVHLPAEPWAFQGLKELHLHFYQKKQYSLTNTAKQELEAGGRMFKQIGKLIHLEILALDFYGYDSEYGWDLDDSMRSEWLKEIAGLDKMRYLCMPSDCWGEQYLSKIIDSSWPRLERVSSRRYDPMDFRWIKERRPWLKIGDLE